MSSPIKQPTYQIKIRVMFSNDFVKISIKIIKSMKNQNINQTKFQS